MWWTRTWKTSTRPEVWSTSQMVAKRHSRRLYEVIKVKKILGEIVMIQWWQNFTTYFVLNLSNLWWVDDCFISRLTSLCSFITGLVMGDLGTKDALYRSFSSIGSARWGTFVGASRIDATSICRSCNCLSVAQGIKPEIAIVLRSRSCSLDLCRYHLAVWVLLPLHRIDTAIEPLIIKKVNATTFLVLFSRLHSHVPFQSSWLLPLVRLRFCPIYLLFVAKKYQWFKRLDSCRTYASWSDLILLHCACETSPSLSCLGFGLTAMLTVLYSNVQSVSAAISANNGTDAFAKLPKEQMVAFTSNFKSIYDRGCAIIGIFLQCNALKTANVQLWHPASM